MLEWADPSQTAHTAMVAAIREDRTPNLLMMRYALATWKVRDRLLIPSFMFAAARRPSSLHFRLRSALRDSMRLERDG